VPTQKLTQTPTQKPTQKPISYPSFLSIPSSKSMTPILPISLFSLPFTAISPQNLKRTNDCNQVNPNAKQSILSNGLTNQYKKKVLQESDDENDEETDDENNKEPRKKKPKHSHFQIEDVDTEVFEDFYQKSFHELDKNKQEFILYLMNEYKKYKKTKLFDSAIIKRINNHYVIPSECNKKPIVYCFYKIHNENIDIFLRTDVRVFVKKYIQEFKMFQKQAVKPFSVEQQKPTQEAYEKEGYISIEN